MIRDRVESSSRTGSNISEAGEKREFNNCLIPMVIKLSDQTDVRAFASRRIVEDFYHMLKGKNKAAQKVVVWLARSIFDSVRLALSYDSTNMLRLASWQFFYVSDCPVAIE